MKKKRIRYSRIIGVLVCLILLINLGYKTIEKSIYRTDYSEYVKKYAQMYEIDENLIYAIIKNESKFDPNAVSSVGAKGLMQIMDETAEDVAKMLNLEEYDIFSPEDNIKIGVKYYSYLYGKYGKVSLALAAYNAGGGTVDNWITQGIIKNDGSDYENIPYKETNMYVRKILKDYDYYISFNVNKS